MTNQIFLGHNLTALQSGKYVVTYPKSREGFTVPEAVLVGTFDNVEQAKVAITESLGEKYQVQIVLVKRTGHDPFNFEEIMRTDPVYVANVDTSGHVDAVVAAIERYARSL